MKTKRHYVFRPYRYSAMDVLTVLYLNDGMTEKAEEICEAFPISYFDMADEHLGQLYIEVYLDMRSPLRLGRAVL